MTRDAPAEFRRMRADEMPLVLDWAADEGWNPGLEDAAAFLTADPQGFFVATIADHPVAAISVVNHDPAMAFLGLYLCQPAYRGRGIGFGLWQHALAHAGDRTIGLDGVAAQQTNYARSGFRAAGATLRLEGRVEGASFPDIRAATKGDRDDLLALDRAAIGYARPAFLGAWLRDCETRRTIVLTTAAAAVGFATIRRCRTGCKIGPLVAPDSNSALRLVRAAVATLPGDPTVIDLPDVRGDFTTALQREGFTETFRTARMYRGTAPVAAPILQAVGTLELG